jgi:tetratricopeptide (TPR) repeat protein
MKKTLFVVISLMLISYSGFSQAYKGTGRLRGMVTDMDGNPLESATIKLFSISANSGFETKSDKKGKWKADWIRGGLWHIDFIKIGYEPHKISIRISELGKNPLLEIKLKKIEGLAMTEKIVEHFEKANKYFDEEKYDKAIAAYGKILGDYPEAFIINKNIGNAYFALGDYENAVKFYKKVMEKQEKNSEMSILIGNAYINKKDNEKAFEWYRKVNVEDIEDVIPVYNIGVLFFNERNYEKATAYFKRAVEIDDGFSDGYYQLAMSYLASGQNEGVVELLEKFLEIDPESSKAPTASSIIETLTKNRE